MPATRTRTHEDTEPAAACDGTAALPSPLPALPRRITPGAWVPGAVADLPGARARARAARRLRSEAPPRPPWRVLAALTATSVIALVVIVALGRAVHESLLIPPLAASVGLIASLPDQPLAQPRNVIGGHLVCCVVGSLTALLLGHGVLVAAIAGGLAVGATLTLRVAHSPAAATAVIVAATPLPFWHFSTLLTLTTVVLVGVGVVDARIRGRTYPVYWW